MPSLKLNVDTKAKSGFEPYDGPEVPTGNGYEAVIKKVALKKSKTGNMYFNVVLELQTKDKERVKYNGAPVFHRIMIMDSESQQARLGMFMEAITGANKAEQSVVYEGGEDEISSSAGAKVTKIGGKNPVGKVVKVDVRYNNDGDYGRQMNPDNLRKAGPVSSDDDIDEDDIDVEEDEDEATSAESADSPDEADEDETDEDDDLTEDERRAELKKLPIKELRELAEETEEIETKGLKKADLVEAIVAWEFDLNEDDEDADEDEDSEDEEDEPDEDEESDEEDEDEDEDDPYTEMDRGALKAEIKKRNPEFKVLKRHTDDDLREVARNLPPF